MANIDQLIRREIHVAIERLGGTPRWLEDATPEQLYRLAEQCGADRYLLGAIGSCQAGRDHHVEGAVARRRVAVDARALR